MLISVKLPLKTDFLWTFIFIYLFWKYFRRQKNETFASDSFFMFWNWLSALYEQFLNIIYYSYSGHACALWLRLNIISLTTTQMGAEGGSLSAWKSLGCALLAGTALTASAYLKNLILQYVGCLFV